MDFVDALPITFKEITPNHCIPEKWREIVLNTGGTHSTLQDIKLPQKAGGYWYKDSLKAATRNRFIYWQTTSDAIELSEASMDVNLTAANLKCKVAPGTPPLNGMTVWERTATKEVIILAATVSSVHRLIFPHPELLNKKATFGSSYNTGTSVFHDTSSINNPNNYYILNQHSNANSGVAHTFASLVRENGEAVFVLAFGQGGDGGLLVVKLPVTGAAITHSLKRESTVPRFLSGLTGALRGKTVTESVETYGVVLSGAWAVAVCGDACLRAWLVDESGAPAAVSVSLSSNTMRPKPPPHGHMLQKIVGGDGVILVAYLSFPNECEFVVMKMQPNGAGAIKFSQVCRLFGPQLDLLDYTLGYGDGGYVVWALWSQPDGETLVTTSGLGAEVRWQAVAARESTAPLPQLSSHQKYRDHLLAPGLFPPSVVRKALVIYRRTWGSADSGVAADGELGEAAMSAVRARLNHLAARPAQTDHTHLLHKCWSDLYSWCMQYMESLQKPLGLMVSNQDIQLSSGWWCAVVRRAGISLVRELEPLERMMLSADSDDWENDSEVRMAQLSVEARRVVAAGAYLERALGGAARGLERRLFTCSAPQHRLLPHLLQLLLHDTTPILSPQQIDDLKSMLEPIKDLQNAILELNDVLRLDVPEINTTKDSFEEASEYNNLLSSDLGVAVVTESIQQMAEMRARVVRGCVGAVGVARGAGGVPGAGHCVVHWQAYRALQWLAPHTLQHKSSGSSSDELFRLKLSALNSEAVQVPGGPATGVVLAYVAGAGGARARAHLEAARAPTTCHHALPLFTYHLAHQLWAVNGSFDFGWWLASINQPRLIQNYVSLLAPWCEWNACSREFILGLALLDLDDAEGAYTAFCKAVQGVSKEPFLRQMITSSGTPSTQHQAQVLYYMKVIKLFEIHDAGACVVRLAETAISIADKDDPNLSMFQWLVFKWHLSCGRVDRALSAAAANPSPNARASAAANLLTTLASRKQLGALVSCGGALSMEAERAASTRARLHDAHTHNPYYNFLYALHVSRQHYRKGAAVMYERAARCGAEGGGAAAARARRRYLAAALSCLRLAAPNDAFLVKAASTEKPQVIGPEDLAKELRDEDPESQDMVQQALLGNDHVDFDYLYPKLKDADAETLLSVLKRVLSTGQFIPQWFLNQYMKVDGNNCIRCLLAGGRVTAAGEACVAAVRNVLRHPLVCSTAPASCPLAAADLVMAELTYHIQDPYCKQVYDELDTILKDYIELVKRTSEDMKLAQLNSQFRVN